MDRSSTRAWRRIQKKRLWRNRLRFIFRTSNVEAFENPITGQRREADCWKELRGLKWSHVYKTTGKPCSCTICTGEQYNRRNFKRESAKFISEQLDCE